MAHAVASMAYVGETPWHGLGNRLADKQPIEVWADQAGMDWRIEQTPVCFRSDAVGQLGVLQTFADQKVLYRSDTKTPLSVVSNRYQVVQPREVLEFYRDLTEVAGYELETAGVLKGGRKFWALAKTGQNTTLKGKDAVNGYLLLATSCDGSLATTATPTTVRVVCNNTLSVSLNGAVSAVKVAHRSKFDALAVKRQLGVAVSGWDSFMYNMKVLSERKVKSHEAMRYFLRVVSEQSSGSVAAAPINERALKKMLALYEGAGKGSELESAKGTAWGLLNAVTEYVDHHKQARSSDNRLDSAWFGQGAGIKQRALDEALLLAA